MRLSSYRGEQETKPVGKKSKGPVLDSSGSEPRASGFELSLRPKAEGSCPRPLGGELGEQSV